MPVNLLNIRRMNEDWAHVIGPWAGVLLPNRDVTFKPLKNNRYRVQGGCGGIVRQKQLEPFRSNLAAGGDGSTVIKRGPPPKKTWRPKHDSDFRRKHR